MLKRWLPHDPVLKRAFYGIVVFVLCFGIAGGLKAWEGSKRGAEHQEKAVAQAVWQYGPSSKEAADAVKQLSEQGGPKEVVALLDPTTGAAVAAWPTEFAGKKPEEMALPSGIKLPPLGMMQYRQRFTMEKPGAGDDKELSVRVAPLYPWSNLGEGDDHEGDFRGGASGWHGHEGRGDREKSGLGAGPAPAALQPQAILLTVAPRPGVTPILITAGAVGALAALGFTIYWLSLAWWVYADARQRGGQAFAWGVLALLTNVVGAAVYLVARQQQRTCHSCGTTVHRSFNHCPRCGNGLKQVCTQCGHALHPTWAYCVECGIRSVPPGSDVTGEADPSQP